MPPRRPPARLALVLLLLGLATCRGGCGKKAAPPAPAAAGALDWFPSDTRIVVGIDFARLRATTLWSQLGSLATTDPGDRQKIDELASRTGFDPLKQVDELIVAFPEEARAQGGMGMLMRGRGLDENRLIAYVRDQVAKQGDDLFSFRHAGRTLWATRREPTTAGFFIDQSTFVLGTGGWAERMAELSASPPGPSSANATGNEPLVHLVDRAGPARAIWAAAIVPASTRSALAGDPSLPGAANVNRLALGIDLSSGVDAHLLADVSTHAEAEEMARQVGDAVLAAKKSPQVLLMGVGPYLDGVTAKATGVSCEIGVRLSPAQASDGVDRLKALLSLARQGAVPGFPHP